jgi:hypothetical protein
MQRKIEIYGKNTGFATHTLHKKYKLFIDNKQCIAALFNK